MHMPQEKQSATQEQPLVRFGLGLANWSERWFPDPLIFALLGIVVVFVVGLWLHQSPTKLAIQGGKNFWTLVPFTMQMVMIIIGGYVVASTPIVYRAIQGLAGIPKTPRQAVALVALFSMLTSLISWGLSLIFSGLFVRELAHRVKGMDYRAAGGAAYLGLGAVWAMGLSSSAAMLMATKSAMPPSLFNISGLIPLTQTLFLWQSIATTGILIVLSVLVAYMSTPSAENARTAESYGIQYEPIRSSLEPKSKPGEWLEYSPLLTVLVAALLCWYLVDVFRTSPQGALAALDLNTYNLMFITVGLLLHWRPKRFMRAVVECIPATGGVLIQFPFYAVIETGNLGGNETSNIRSIYDNGVILASAPDENAAEEAVHYALLEHPAPRRVLLIGGGVNGSIAQALKHPTVERIDYVELDPALIDMARQFFPAQSASVVSDPRVHVHYADGRFFLRSLRHDLRMAGRAFDVIILNVPDPQTAQLNRFYTAEFFRSARDRLAPGGLLALQLRSSEDYISPDMAEFLRCIHHTLRQVFPYVVAIPGETIHFFAATRPDVLTDNPQALIKRLQERNLKTQYVREYFIPFRMMPDRMEQVQEQLRPLPSTPVNRDFEPIAYYFDVVLWSAQFKLGYSRWFRAAAHIAFAEVIDTVLVVTLLSAALLAFVRAREKRARSAAATCMAATGFTLMTLQIFLLLAFQSIYGYVYHQLAILVAMCMAGIAAGSWLGIRRIRPSDSPPGRTMATTQFLLALSGPALIFVVSLLSKISGMAATWLAAQLVFPALAALCGTLGGYQFPIATEIYLYGDGDDDDKEDENNSGRSGRSRLGTLYALDLLGGCAGALLLSSYLIPVFGFWKTAWLSAAVNLAPSLLAARLSSEAQRHRA